MRIGTDVLGDIFIRGYTRIGTETVSGLWSNACSKHVRAMAHVRRDRTRGEGTVREMGVGLEAAHAILERLEGRRRVSGTIAHGIIISEIGVITSAAEVRDPALREDIGVMAIGKALLVAAEREDRRVLNSGHGVTWCEGGDLSRAATVGGGDAAHHVVRAAVGVGKRGRVV